MDRVARQRHRPAVLVITETLCAECNPLIQSDILSNNRRFSDDDAGSMVDGEAFADGRAGMDVDARGVMGILRQHARQDLYAHLQQGMGRPVIEHGRDGGIAPDDLLLALDGRVVVREGFHVALKQALDLRDPAQERFGDDRGRQLPQMFINVMKRVFLLHIAVEGEDHVFHRDHHVLQMVNGPVQGKVHQARG